MCERTYACMRVCVRTRVRACMRACVRVYMYRTRGFQVTKKRKSLFIHHTTSST